MSVALPLTEILERDWDAQLFATTKKPGLATQLGWHSHWTFDSRGSAHGFPDRTVCKDRVIFVELKRELTTSKSVNRQRQPTAMQVEWLDRLARAGAEVYLWRPSDLDEIARILSQASHWERGVGLHAHENTGWRYWQPASLWIAGQGRADTIGQQTIEAA